MPTASQLTEKLTSLRTLWLNHKSDPQMQKVIEAQAKAIKTAISLKQTNHAHSNDPFIKEVAKQLF